MHKLNAHVLCQTYGIHAVYCVLVNSHTKNISTAFLSPLEDSALCYIVRLNTQGKEMQNFVDSHGPLAAAFKTDNFPRSLVEIRSRVGVLFYMRHSRLKYCLSNQQGQAIFLVELDHTCLWSWGPGVVVQSQGFCLHYSFNFVNYTKKKTGGICYRVLKVLSWLMQGMTYGVLCIASFILADAGYDVRCIVYCRFYPGWCRVRRMVGEYAGKHLLSMPCQIFSQTSRILGMEVKCAIVCVFVAFFFLPPRLLYSTS